MGDRAKDNKAEGDLKTYGYTTGTYAVAAVKAAATVLLGNKTPTRISVSLPGGVIATVPVLSIERSDGSVTAKVVKKSVETTDVTDGMTIAACVVFREDSALSNKDAVHIDGGVGIGRVTREGLQLKVGEAAINPTPRKMIEDNIRELTTRPMDVIISAPNGSAIAEKTYNARLGIVGGISIIGTTGIMKAKSSESFKDTILTQLDFIKANNSKEIVITPGNISEEAMLSRFKGKVSRDIIVQSGDFLGFTLKEAANRGLTFVLAGHPGKLAKVLDNNFQTHYSKARPANKAVVELLENHLDDETVESLKGSPTVEGMMTILIKKNHADLIDILANRIEECVKEYLSLDAPIATLLFNMDKELIGASKAGKAWITE